MRRKDRQNMKSGLSALRFIKNNKKSCAVLIVALSLTFMAMYVVNFLLMATEESFKTIMLELPKKVSYVSFGDEALGIKEGDYNSPEEYSRAYAERRAELCERLKALDGIDDAKYTQIINAEYDGLIGQIFYEVPLLKADEIQEYMDHFGAKIKEGRMPENAGEILLDETVLKNQKYKVGDWFRADAYGETFKIVGTLESDYMASVGIPNGYTNSGWYHVIYCNEATSKFSETAEKLGIKSEEMNEVIDILTYKKFYDGEVVKTINSAVNVIVIVVMIFLAVSVIVAYVSFLRNRLNEYCLYASIGYSRKNIYGLIMREMLLIFSIGIITGAVVSVAVMSVLDQGMIKPIGLVSKWIYPEHVLKMLAAFTCIIGILQIPVLAAVNGIKTIDMLDD